MLVSESDIKYRRCLTDETAAAAVSKQYSARWSYSNYANVVVACPRSKSKRRLAVDRRTEYYCSLRTMLL